MTYLHFDLGANAARSHHRQQVISRPRWLKGLLCELGLHWPHQPAKGNQPWSTQSRGRLSYIHLTWANSVTCIKSGNFSCQYITILGHLSCRLIAHSSACSAFGISNDSGLLISVFSILHKSGLLISAFSASHKSGLLISVFSTSHKSGQLISAFSTSHKSRLLISTFRILHIWAAQGSQLSVHGANPGYLTYILHFSQNRLPWQYHVYCTNLGYLSYQSTELTNLGCLSLISCIERIWATSDNFIMTYTNLGYLTELSAYQKPESGLSLVHLSFCRNLGYFIHQHSTSHEFGLYKFYSVQGTNLGLLRNIQNIVRIRAGYVKAGADSTGMAQSIIPDNSLQRELALNQTNVADQQFVPTAHMQCCAVHIRNYLLINFWKGSSERYDFFFQDYYCKVAILVIPTLSQSIHLNNQCKVAKLVIPKLWKSSTCTLCAKL